MDYEWLGFPPALPGCGGDGPGSARERVAPAGGPDRRFVPWPLDKAAGDTRAAGSVDVRPYPCPAAVMSPLPCRTRRRGPAGSSELCEWQRSLVVAHAMKCHRPRVEWALVKVSVAGYINDIEKERTTTARRHEEG
jgi:hypothetical protein